MATRWRLDTCECVLVYDSLDGDKPVNCVVENDCGKHGAKLKPAKLFAEVLKEQRKRAKA